MQKILALAWRELYTTYTDRNQLLIMIATPLALATIIGLAFSQLFTNGGSDIPIRDIPIIVVNLDDGTTTTDGTSFNSGQTFIDLLVPPEVTSPVDDNVLFDLTNAVQMDDPAAARARVDSGEYAAAIIIPPEFSANASYDQARGGIAQAVVEVYTSPAQPVSANVAQSIAARITNTLATGNITVAATINTLIARANADPAFGLQFGAAGLTGSFQPDFAPAFDPTGSPVTIVQQTVSGEAAGFNPLVLFGSAQAIFFMMFTAQGGANSLLEERRDGTLQRLVVTPTSRITLLLGKMLGVFTTCVVQVLMLLLLLTLVASLISGQIQFIWGTNLFSIALVIGSAAFAASGLGILITGIARTPEQANIFGGMITILFGLLGNAFFNLSQIPAVAPFSRISMTYWAVDAFTKLASNNSAIALNLGVLAGQGVIMFLIGLWLFNRRLEV